MNIKQKVEYELSAQLAKAIADLFQKSFVGYPEGLIYYNQVPDFRLLAWKEDALIGHLGVQHRNISVNNQILSVFGIVDLCVAPEVQLNNVGSELVQSLSNLANNNQVDFIMLTSEINEFYLKNEFVVVHNPCRWLVIHDHESMGVFRRELKQGLMVKGTSDKEWPTGEVDFMGHMF